MFRIVITERARDDADAAFAWIRENISSDQAATWYRGLLEHIESLTKLPGRCPVARESIRFPEEVREPVYGKARHKHRYRILFTIRNDQAVILAIHHSSRSRWKP